MNNKPNFIIIHTDQHRGDCLGIEGRKGLFTPNLDYLAVKGARFTAAYSTCPVCIPQRLSLLTGQLASTHGVLGNAGIPYFPMGRNLPRELGAGGYQTALVGRGFHTYPSDEPYGFEYYVPGDPSSELKETKDHFFRDFREKTGKYSNYYYANGTDNNSLLGVPFHMDTEYHHTHWTTERALEFLKKRDKDRPFLLTVGYYAPHGPQNPPADFFNRYYYSNQELDDPAIGEWDIPPVANWNPNHGSYMNLEGELWRTTRSGYYGNITFIDHQVGRILGALGMIPNTYIIFTSDHGEMLGDHYMYHKSRPYQGAARIPFLIAGPDIEPLQVCDKTVGWHDIMPTLLELAGLPCPEGVDGSSILPLVNRSGSGAGEAANANAVAEGWREYIHGECPAKGFLNRTLHRLPGQQIEDNFIYEDSGWHYLTDGKVKYIWHVKTGKEQFFDLLADKDEKNDLVRIDRYEEIIRPWRKRLAEVLKDRPEGFSDGENLKSGVEYKGLLPQAQKLANQRIEEGHDIAYFYYQKGRGLR